jgi:hypothetical protein
MSGKKHLRGRERSSARPADSTTGLSFYPLTPDRWDDFEVALYTGTEGSFARAGFHVVATPTPVRRIMRKQL